MSKTTMVTAPAGMSGLWVEPWSRGEIYAVAADWAQASCPVLVYGEDGWTNDSHGRQVADFRHNERAALDSEIREAMGASGDEPDDEVNGILDDAEPLTDADLADMIGVLESYGDTFAGNSATDTAQEWIDAGFAADAANSWMDAGFWDAATAAECETAGLSPSDATAAATNLIEASEDASEDYTDGSPIYAACNGDISAQLIIDALEA